MLEEFHKHIQENFAPLVENRFLMAVSGGVDSVVLAHLCHRLKLNFALAHCNFQLRGEESDNDENFVKDHANKWGVQFHVSRFDTIGYINREKVSLQVAARDLRYAWFERLMQKFGYDRLVTAHHLDDNLETFLINLSRGTGLGGLTGIPENTDSIARPLLAFSRQRIMEYAKSENLQWREDGSNEDTKYLRNKIRHELVPKLKRLHPTFLENFEMTIDQLKGSDLLIQNYIQGLKTEIFVQEGEVIHIPIKKLRQLNPVQPHLYEFFKGYGFTAWNDIYGLLSATSGKEVRSKTHRLLKDRTELLLTKLEDAKKEVFYISETTKLLEFPVQLSIDQVDNYEKANTQDILYIDKKALKYPLMLRKWQEGDYFYPMGMDGRKKVSKFFKDEKMDKFSKERQWLLFSNNQLVWILGKRGDERFKVSDTTESILKLTLN